MPELTSTTIRYGTTEWLKCFRRCGARNTEAVVAVASAPGSRRIALEYVIRLDSRRTLASYLVKR